VAFNVLVLDDSSVMRAMIIKTLRLSGVELGQVHQAENGRVALDVLEDHWVDLALVDINMPVMNGVEFIEHVRRDPAARDLAVIVVSTESSETRIEMVKRLGASFVHKPFTPELLRACIVEITGVTDEEVECEAVGDGSFDF
jgi:two-component system, chemotaxis family, chemotaxis protein CheY